MNTMFPFGLDAPTAAYLSLYVVTLALHAFFMTYVLAGSLWTAWATMFPGSGDVPRAKQPLALMLRDWMPFVLSAAITAGVAPLLFVQVIYRSSFYTANLLIGWRWLMVVPALVAGAYLLYLKKSRLISQWSFAGRAALGFGTAACFLFVAFCWSTNHLLSLDRSAWPDAYTTGSVIGDGGPLLLRLATWIAAAFPTMSVLAGWQLTGLDRKDDSDSERLRCELRRLTLVSLAGFVLAGVCGAAYVAQLEPAVRSNLTGAAGGPWLIVLGISVAIQSVGWLMQFRAGALCRWRMLIVTLGCVGSLISTVSLREIIRLAHANLSQVTASTREAAQIGGLAAFLVFTLINIALITWCIRLVRVDGRATEPHTASTQE